MVEDGGGDDGEESARNVEVAARFECEQYAATPARRSLAVTFGKLCKKSGQWARGALTGPRWPSLAPTGPH